MSSELIYQVFQQIKPWEWQLLATTKVDIQ